MRARRRLLILWRIKMAEDKMHPEVYKFIGEQTKLLEQRLKEFEALDLESLTTHQKEEIAWFAGLALGLSSFFNVLWRQNSGFNSITADLRNRVLFGLNVSFNELCHENDIREWKEEKEQTL